MPGSICSERFVIADFFPNSFHVFIDSLDELVFGLHFLFLSHGFLDKRGRLHIWSFIIENEGTNQPLSDFLVPTTKIEQYAVIKLCDKLVVQEIERWQLI
jgi:endonuclease G